MLGGETIIAALNVAALILNLPHDKHGLWKAGLILLVYRGLFLWAFATGQRFCHALYGLFNGLFVIRNALLLSGIFIYVSSRGTRFLKTGDLYVGDAAISLFGLVSLLIATLIRSYGVYWSFSSEATTRFDRVSPWPAIALAAPILIPGIYIAAVSSRVSKVLWFGLYDLMAFYGYGIFL